MTIMTMSFAQSNFLYPHITMLYTQCIHFAELSGQHLCALSDNASKLPLVINEEYFICVQNKYYYVFFIIICNLRNSTHINLPENIDNTGSKNLITVSLINDRDNLVFWYIVHLLL
jgi:hypothetical protein